METTIHNSNYAMFVKLLTAQYEELFKLPAYAICATKYTPQSMAERMTGGLAGPIDSADKNGVGVQAVRKALGIGNTYKAIREFLHS